ERVDLALLAVEGEGVVTAASIDLERLVEPGLELRGLALEAVGELAVSPHLARDLGDPALRVEDVPLHLARRDRRLGEPAVGVALRVARVLPRLVLEPVRRSALVLDESVAVAVAVAVDPLERTQRRLLEVTHASPVVRPEPDLGEEHEIERRRVDRPVVEREEDFGGL